MVGFGALAILVAVLGMLTAYFKNAICAGCFGFWSFLLSIIFLLIGALLIFIGTYAQTLITDFCNGDLQESYLDDFKQSIEDIDHSMGAVTADYMCKS
mmetsp:Transcript_38287/g.36642  ORF Transcript_38287/g.36642 Transcript_38287/m.36642 type:complete len:98 (+) Transcript_38287:197-490(+)